MTSSKVGGLMEVMSTPLADMKEEIRDRSHWRKCIDVVAES